MVLTIEEAIESSGRCNDEDDSTAYSPETIAKFKETIVALRTAAVMAKRVDFLLAGDDGEETFHERWEQELTQLKKREEYEY